MRRVRTGLDRIAAGDPEVLGVLPQVHSITTYVLMDSPKDERA